MITSREAALDAIELITNQIALTSHCQELINTYSIDYEKEHYQSNKEKIAVKIDQQFEIMSKAIDMRRELTNQIKEEFDTEPKMRCSFKHAVAAYGFATELAYAYKDTDKAPFYQKFQQQSYEQLMKVASLFLWLEEILSCGRCLLEALQAKWRIIKPVEQQVA